MQPTHTERARWTPYTEDDDNRIIQLRYREHLSVQKIGVIMNRRHASINTRLQHPTLVARIPPELRAEAAATSSHHRTLAEAGGLDSERTIVVPRTLRPDIIIADRDDVVVKKVLVHSFYKTRTISVTLPRLKCLELEPA